jgi:hypothetical protein
MSHSARLLALLLAVAVPAAALAEPDDCALEILPEKEGQATTYDKDGKRTGTVDRSAIAGSAVIGCNEELGLVRLPDSDGRERWVNRSLAKRSAAKPGEKSCTTTAPSKDPDNKPATTSGIGRSKSHCE